MDSTLINCCICKELLQNSKRLIEILDCLECLVKINYKILEESSICDICLEKVQSAYRFKTSYLENSKIKTVKEHVCPDMCIICKNNIDVNESSSLVNSSGSNLHLLKYLSEELDPNFYDSSQICEPCQKSLLNFYFVINILLSNFNPDSLCQINESVDSDFNFKVEDELYNLENLKKEPQDNNAYEEFLAKNEEIDVKMDGGEENLDDRLQQKHEPENEQDSLVSKLDHCKRIRNMIQRNQQIRVQNSFNEVEHFFKCQFCKFQTRSKIYLYKRHMLVHKNFNETELIKCKLCEYKTKFKNNLTKHKLVHKNCDEVEMFECQTCKYKTKYRSYIKTHMLSHKNPDEVEMFKCHNCEYKSRHKSILKVHMLTHKNSDEVEMFKCQFCDHETKRKTNLTQHMKMHNPEVEMFKCEICDYKTYRKNYLTKHVLIHKDSDEIEMFKCQICGFNTKHKSNLTQHLKIHNPEVKMLKCQICDYKTYRKNNLKKHLILHKDSHEIEMYKSEKKYKCHLCEYRTNCRSYLTRKHMLVHKNSDEVEMFKCQICNFQTKHKYSLKTHMLVHKNCVEVKT